MPDKITKKITAKLVKSADPKHVKKASKILRDAHDKAHALLSGTEEVKDKIKRVRQSVPVEEKPKSFFDAPRSASGPALEKPDVEKPRLASKIESTMFDSVVHQPPKERVKWAGQNTESWPRLAVMFGDNPLRSKMMSSELSKEPDRQRSVILGLIAKHGSELHRSELRKHHDPYVRKMAGGELKEERKFVLSLIKEAAKRKKV